MRTRRPLVTAAAALLAAGCGGDETSRSAAVEPPQAKPAALKADAVVQLVAPNTAPGTFRFDKKKLETPAGLVELRLDNRDDLPHNIRIQTGERCCDAANDIGGTDTALASTKIDGRVKLEPGTYWFICSIKSHHLGAGGLMRGKLIVQ